MLGFSVWWKKFNKGSGVPGSGNGDTVPAMLTPGEFVMSKRCSSRSMELDTLEVNECCMGGGT